MKEHGTFTTQENHIGIIELVIPDHLKNAGITDIHSDKRNDTLVIRYNNRRLVCTLKDKNSTIREIYSLPERVYYVTGEIFDLSLICSLSRFIKENWQVLTGKQMQGVVSNV